MKAWNTSAAENKPSGGCEPHSAPLPSRVLLDGHAVPPPPPLPLRAGPWTLLFEEAGLRYIRLGEHEIVRRIYAAVRDENWGTVPATIRNLRTEVGRSSFAIEFEAQHVQPPIDFTWRGTIVGAADGRLTFTMDGMANRTFRKNRIGFCLLHPLGLAGRDVEVIHADGRLRQVDRNEAGDAGAPAGQGRLSASPETNRRPSAWIKAETAAAASQTRT